MILRNLLVVSLTVILSACATTVPEPPTPAQMAADKGYELGEPIEKIMNYRLDGWNYVNPYALIIHSGANKNHLVTLRDRCHELSTADVIATTSTGSAMRAKFDAIIVSLDGSRPSGSTRNTRKCYIESIYTMTKNKTTNKTATGISE